MPKDNIPLYQIDIDESEDSFVFAVALVKEPAIESNWIAFSKANEPLKFSTDDVKQELLGAVLIPDIPILRIDDKGNPYNVVFSKENIRLASQIFFKRGLQGSMNLNHTDKPSDSYVFQSYIVDESKGISSPKGLNLPNGSWVVGAKVDNPDTWQDVKAGKVLGFSVEGLFKLINTTNYNNSISEMDKEAKELLDVLKSLNQSIEKIKNSNEYN